jgi:hypothetical protein
VPLGEHIYDGGERHLLNYIHVAVQSALGVQHINLTSPVTSSRKSVTTTLTWGPGYKVCFPFKLAYILGFCDSPKPSDDSDDMWHPHHPDATGLTADWPARMSDSPWLPGGICIARDPIDVSRMVPMTIMVTANTADATRNANVLQVVPVPTPVVPTRQEDSSYHGTMSMDFKNPKYFEVDIAQLNELFFFKLMPMNNIGKIIPLDYVYDDPNGEICICIKLHFRVVAEE